MFRHRPFVRCLVGLGQGGQAKGQKETGGQRLRAYGTPFEEKEEFVREREDFYSSGVQAARGLFRSRSSEPPGPKQRHRAIREGNSFAREMAPQTVCAMLPPSLVSYHYLSRASRRTRVRVA
ncbi:hypothetical protein MTO96_018234 [Rhipicephalus appendiculatus]